MSLTLDHDTIATPRGASPARPAALDEASPPLVVAIATPFGAGGRGGMDRLTDLVVDRVNVGADGFANTSALRLTVRGQHGNAFGSIMFMSAAIRLALMCMFGRIQLLHLNVAVHGSCFRKYLLSRIARRFGVPYVVHIHSGRFGQFWNSASDTVTARIDTFMRDSAGVIVLGNMYRELFASRLPDVLPKVWVLPNATRARSVGLHSRAPGEPVRITFLGRLGTLKGTPQLIEALGTMKSKPGWTATLAGDGDVAASRNRIAELGLADRVSLPGWLGSEAVDRLLADTDVFILPSFSEGLPMSIIEAFATGIAVIATPVNAVVDVVQHEHNGLLVEPGDVAGIAAALARLIDDPDLRRRLGAAGKLDHQQHYDEGAFLKRLETIWRSSAEPQ